MRLLVDSCVFLDSFDPSSPNYTDALQLLTELRVKGQTITMPAHGWFEVQCTFQRLRAEGRFVGPQIAGRMEYSLELMDIDGHFIEKYAMVDVPYIKSGDHIFIAVAKTNGWPLVTSDEKMLAVAKECGVKVFQPAEFMQVLRDGT
ncbi:MAG TPA: PIN domain-containing protein [Burkholderiales bacterium]|nr:PIN domain-containing protein [Burkholderiales bacterium]